MDVIQKEAHIYISYIKTFLFNKKEKRKIIIIFHIQDENMKK